MPAALLLLLAATALPAKPARYVTDRAGVIKNADALNERLANFERQTSDQILVYTDQHLPADTTIEEMGAEAIRKWGVGQKGKDNGAILFVFVGDRKMRIEVGYGLEGSLTDAKAKWITSTVIKPEFQRGEFSDGINNGVDAMLATVRGEPYRATGATVAETHRRPTLKSVLPFLLWPSMIGFLILILIAVRRAPQRPTAPTFSRFSPEPSDYEPPPSPPSEPSSSSFEGGGGSGGGGGASDSW
jgi:uncharacterized protein